MRTIFVDPNAVDVPAYDSADAAIRAELTSDRAARSAVDSSRVSGKLARAFEISDQSVLMSLSNGLFLTLTANEKTVEWSISESAASGPSRPGQNDDAVELVWPDGEHTTWERASLLRSELSAPVRKIFGGQVFVNLYFDCGDVIQFVTLWNRISKSTLLYFYQLESKAVGNPAI